MRTAAILPVKRFSHAKQRLSSDVAEPMRLQLAQAMVSDVLQTLSRSRMLDLIIIVTGEPSIASSARAEALGSHRVILLADSAEDGQNAAVTLGIQRALSVGIQRVLCVPGDCPCLDEGDLAALLAPNPLAHSEPRGEVVIVPDRHGTGTNGLLLSPPTAIPPSFGQNSCERHLTLARQAQLRCSVQRLPSLMLDIDTSEDLDVLRSRLAGEDGKAPRTRRVLGLSGQATWAASTSAA